MSLKTRIARLEARLSGNRIAYLSISPGEDFWAAAERVIDSGEEPGTINFGEILREIEGTSRGLPSEEERERIRSGKGYEKSMAMVGLWPGETFKNAIQRLKLSGDMSNVIIG